MGGIGAVGRPAAARRRGGWGYPRPRPPPSGALPRPAGRSAGGGQRGPVGRAAVLGWPAAAGERDRGGTVAATADDHPAGHPGHLVCGHGDRDRPDPRLCLHPGRARVLLRPRTGQAGAGAAGQYRRLGRRRHGGLQRRGLLYRPRQREGRARLRDPAGHPAGVRERRQPAAVRRPRPAGTPLCHRRPHPRADRAGHGRGGGRPPDPHLCGVRQRADVPDRAGRAGPGRARPHRRLRPLPSAAGLPHRHRLGRPHPDRDGRVPHPRRHRHLLCPVRPLPLVPVGAEGRARPQPVPAAVVGGPAAAGRAPARSGGRGCWCSARAWAPGPARTW